MGVIFSSLELSRHMHINCFMHGETFLGLILCDSTLLLVLIVYCLLFLFMDGCGSKILFRHAYNVCYLWVVFTSSEVGT